MHSYAQGYLPTLQSFQPELLQRLELLVNIDLVRPGRGYQSDRHLPGTVAQRYWLRCQLAPHRSFRQQSCSQASRERTPAPASGWTCGYRLSTGRSGNQTIPAAGRDRFRPRSHRYEIGRFDGYLCLEGSRRSQF